MFAINRVDKVSQPVFNIYFKMNRLIDLCLGVWMLWNRYPLHYLVSPFFHTAIFNWVLRKRWVFDFLLESNMLPLVICPCLILFCFSVYYKKKCYFIFIHLFCGWCKSVSVYIYVLFLVYVNLFICLSVFFFLAFLSFFLFCHFSEFVFSFWSLNINNCQCQNSWFVESM